MLKKQILVFVISSILAISTCYGQKEVLYKQIDTTKLFIEIHQPDKLDTNQKYPAMVFFFGGGWNSGTRTQFVPQAEYFSQRGIVCFLVDYRVKKKHGTSPFVSLKDAKSSIRFIREHASEFHIDTAKIIASGGSAGGHLAAATAIIDAYNDCSDDLSVSCKPNALVLYNPVIDNGPGGYGYERIGKEYKDFSPLHNIQKGAPPTILFLGTKDHLIPVNTVEYYKVVMDKVKSKCVLKIHEGGKHGFFNYKKKNPDFFRNTTLEADTFLQSLGYLNVEPIVEVK